MMEINISGRYKKNVIQHFLTIILEEIIVDTKFWDRRHIGKPHRLLLLRRQFV